MERRKFLMKLAGWSASVAGSFLLLGYLRQFTRRRSGAIKRFSVGYPGDFPVDTFTYIEKHKLFIYRDHEAVQAVSAVCTHLGCTITPTREGFECPCHGSCYDREGKVLSGPAPSSLSWYGMNRSADKSLIVDIDKKVGPEEKYIIS